VPYTYYCLYIADYSVLSEDLTYQIIVGCLAISNVLYKLLVNIGHILVCHITSCMNAPNIRFVYVIILMLLDQIHYVLMCTNIIPQNADTFFHTHVTSPSRVR
jgi:hypothetical protein